MRRKVENEERRGRWQKIRVKSEEKVKEREEGEEERG